MSSSVHTVQLVYTSPNGYSEDRFYTVAAFTSEEKARLFVEWAEQHRTRILAEARDRPFEEWDEITVPPSVRRCLPLNDYNSDDYHFQYDDEFDLDPEFDLPEQKKE